MVLQNSSFFEVPREFSRLIGLKSWDYKRARKMKVTIIGCGGLGSPIARYLARLGIGKLILIDKDNVEIENLNRDGFERVDIGRNKAEVLKEKIENIFYEHRIEIESLPEDVFDVPLEDIARISNLVIAATDSISSRLFTNDTCVLTRTKMINTAFTAEGLRGHVRVIIPGSTACLRCKYFELPSPEKTNLKTKIDMKVKTGYAISPCFTLTFLASQASMMAFKSLFEDELPFNYLAVNLAENCVTKAKINKNPYCTVC